MNDLNHAAKAICYAFLNLIPKESIIGETIEKIINEKIATSSEFATVNRAELFEILIAELSIGKGEITSMSDKIEPWLNEEKANIKFELWNRYKLFMQEKDPSFPVNELDDFTDKILDKCVYPKLNTSWDRRGMVVGHVQSGKTSNYVGVINKAVDSGYKLIIVIAGTISSLRRQTHERIDDGFIGRSSPAFIRERKNNIVGVGKFKANTEIYSLTSSYYSKGDEGDFNQKVANSLNIPIGKNPVVFVIKKNKSILENLIDWLSKDSNVRLIDGQAKLFDVPALIIDDEADSASVNTAKTIEEAKTINKLIRVLLNLFNQNTFIGYTATPYANLFIPQDFNDELTTSVKNKSYKVGEDLFPRDFIVNIKAPQNYIGASKIFGLENPMTGISNEPLNIFRVVNDFSQSPFYVLAAEVDTNDYPKYRSPKKDEPLPYFLPNSLKKAIKSFILTCAIRRIRGHETKHNSMLVHVALLVNWIDRVAYLVNEQMREYTNSINGLDASLISELKELYFIDFVPTTENILENLDYKDIRIKLHDWESVLLELPKAVSKIEVRSVHGTRSISNLEYHNIEEIDYGRYDNGFSVIAVGGSRLSRGITLEGLSVSYYLRTTKMYDSLMQMGRWFGYRPGYVDLCRLYTTEEIFSWFNHVTMATEEMRNDFDEMSALLKRPKDFRLKVRNHHGLLTITSLSKLYFSENIEISFSGENLQTYELLKADKVIKKNYSSFENLFQTLGLPNEIKKHNETDITPRYLVYRNCKHDTICEFLENFINETPSVKNANISEYIKIQKEIKEWSVVLVSNTETRVFIDWNGATKAGERKKNEEVKSYSLKWDNEEITLGCNVRNQQINRHGATYLISKNQIDDITDRQVDLNIKGERDNKEIKKQRALEKKGLILIYALDPRGTPNVDFKTPIIGYSVHFPILENEKKVSYAVTKNGDYVEDIMEDDDQKDKEE
jgi:Z1 domain